MEYEELLTLATVQGLGRIGWDALGQSLLVEVDIEHKDEGMHRFPISLTSEVAEELFVRLGVAFEEKGLEEANTQ
ncbi:hypothetical protein GO013_16675 [Pseudodesulfovibrio sp. JC047]|uniref:hypothetical protein n=1 Tax=Pseudodesulfovibrio sp. JC047 TaxID=2683199 RepID=UPI0013D5933F|nr:hypothetical protein [Pseudodesulfovibrio sp. JC047]NDV21043.1 hypothetical protein [Pseudodesulfovibrio sp. JC047]